MKRFTRLAVLAAGLLGLLGTTAPPAYAQGAFDVTFVGTATVAGGIGYPVETLPVPDPTAPPPPLSCLPLNGIYDAIPNCHPVYDHPRSVTVSSTACVLAGVFTPDKGKPPAETCAFAGSGGTVTGHCGLSGGQITVAVVTPTQTILVDVHFTGVGGLLTITGHYRKPGQHGKVVGEVAAVPNPLPGGSCTNKTQEEFIISGTASAVSDPTL